MEQNIKNPSLIPDWFIFSGGKVAGIRDAKGTEYQFVGASEPGEDGKTPILYISADDCRWYADYRDGRGPILVSQSPAASGMVGPRGETGPSGNSIVLQSAVPADGGVKVTLAWGENETSAFVIPSGAPGSSYTFDPTTTSGGDADPIGVNTNVIATKDDLNDYVKRDDLLPENGISGDYVSQDNKYHFGLATSGIDANKQYAWTTNGWQEVSGGNVSFTLPLNIGSNNTVANDSVGAIGNNCVVGQKSFAMSIKRASASGNAFAFGDDNVAYDSSLAFGWGSSATEFSFAGGQALSANNRSVALGNGNTADYRSFAFGDANKVTYWSQAFGRGLEFNGDQNASTGIGALVIGGWNKTTSGAVFVVGNGTGNGSSRKDALVLTRDGKLTTNKVFVSGTNFDTLGQSRLDGNNTCLGTNWMGVSQSHAGFFKYIDGQNPGDNEIANPGSGIQVEFKPNSTQGDVTVTNTKNGVSTTTKVVNVPAAAYESMSSFDPTNGPNYMLRKTASGFDIGAAVINVTSLPQQTEANAYYFVYDI